MYMRAFLPVPHTRRILPMRSARRILLHMLMPMPLRARRIFIPMRMPHMSMPIIMMRALSPHSIIWEHILMRGDVHPRCHRPRIGRR